MNEPDANQNMEKKCPQCGASLPSGVLEGLCPACLLKAGAAQETTGQPETLPFQPPSVEEVAALFPQLEILAFLGKGGMGAVYKARQPALDRFVALKILPTQAARGAGFADRFNREARALAKLSHPNIVGVHEFGQAQGQPYFIMEYVDGLTLRELERAGKLSPHQALAIVPQICEALQFAHDEGIVHRDIKPENILLDKKGRVKIADFGIAKIMGRGAEAAPAETQGAIGTPHYMAPEQVERPQEVDHRADIFSLGVVFYEMLTGELPLGRFAPPSRKVEVDVRLDEVVLRALEKEPKRRYQQVTQVKTAVETITSTPAGSVSPSHHFLAQEILERDYVLDIGNCLRRGWALVKQDFWPVVGVTALLLLLVQAACSTAVGIVAGGPLMGGLWLYFLKRARGEAAGLETAFSGFQIAFVQLFLVGFISVALTILGFVCLILPGIYLAVVWMFAFLLVADKRMNFWPALELSRKVVSMHWWQLLAFWLVLLLMNLAGALVCGVGLLLTAPITLAATVYAYQDIFGSLCGNAARASGRVGPSGTEVLPGTTPQPSPSAGPAWKAAAIGLSTVVVICGLIGLTELWLVARARHRALIAEQQARAAEVEARFSAEHQDGTVNTVTNSVVEQERLSPAALSLRLEAAATMSNIVEKDRSLALVSTDAASAGEAKLVQTSLGQISTIRTRDEAAHQSALLLAQRGLRKSALEIAGSMSNQTDRDRAMGELAVDGANAGEVDVVASALGGIGNAPKRDDFVQQSATLLANRGLRKEALELAKTISNSTIRDRALSALAQ
jgi:predicted Ser/Thr protein kinase